MKVSNTVVSVLVIAAVLVSAYALGLLIRQVRTGGRAPVSPAAGENAPAGVRRPGEARTMDAPEERAKVKEERAKALEQTSSLTEEQKAKFRTQVRRQVGGRRGDRGSQGLSPQERPLPQVQGQRRGEAERHAEDGNTPVSTGENANTKPSDKTDAEPGKAGPG
jgi:hypothetical protein